MHLLKSIPVILRNLKCGLNRFKNLLDLFLKEIPDTPNGSDYVSSAINGLNQPSNSVRD